MPQPAFSREEPFNGLRPLPPTEAVETLRTLKAAIAARAALADLKGAGHLIPNPTMLLRAAVLQEAKFSSEIENIVTTNDALYQSLSRDRPPPNLAVKEVLSYEQALWSGVARIRNGAPLTTNLFRDIASIVNGFETEVRRLPGTRVRNARDGAIIYSPPEGEARIRDMLQHLCEFLSREDDTEPLIKMALGHYQFEAIHPFPDGNGRMGRVVNVLYLIQENLLVNPFLFLSSYFLRHRFEYYEGLRRVTEDGAWEEWILYVLRGIESTALETRLRIEAIREALETDRAKMLEQASGIYTHELLNIIYTQPYTRINALVKQKVAQRKTASSYLKRLAEIGLLRPVQVGRETLYLNEKLMRLLTETPLARSASAS